MPRSTALAICAALVTTLSSTASAQLSLVERVGLQDGLIVERRLPTEERRIDWQASLMPGISLVSITPRSELSVGYLLRGTLHAVGSSELAHSFLHNGRFELSPRTALFTSAVVTNTTLTNYLLTEPTSRLPTTLFPIGTSPSVLTGNVVEGLAHELGPRVRAEQLATGTFFRALAPAPPLDSFSAVLHGSVERVWERDAVGPEASVGFGLVRAAPPFQDQDYGFGDAGLHWRHDWSWTVSTLVAGGVAALVTPDGSAAPLVAPFAHGSLLYTLDVDAGLTLTASTGVTPNPLTGQALAAHRGSLRGAAPISRHARLYASATVGYLRGSLIDATGDEGRGFHAASSDLEIVWWPAPTVGAFGRYTFNVQLADDRTGPLPSFMRDTFLAGFTLWSRPPEAAGQRGGMRGGSGDGVQFPQRVDRADGAAGRFEGDGADDQPRPSERPPEGVNGTRWNPATPARPTQSPDPEP